MTSWRAASHVDLLLYGSLRARSYSRFLAFEAARLLEEFGADVASSIRMAFRSPMAAHTHPKVQDLRELDAWSEGQV